MAAPPSDSTFKPVIAKDSDTVKNILVTLDLEKGTTSVFSGFDAWDNLAYLLEALGATAQQCRRQGISRKKIYQAIEKYLKQVLIAYDILDD